MTRYAIDEQRGALTAVWSTGDGDTTATIAELPTSTPADHRYELAQTLTELSQALWRTYTHPASAAEDNMEENTEGWRRQGERDAFAVVQASIAKPRLARHGLLVTSNIAVEESAHRVGRALHTIADRQLSNTVATEIDVEIAAVEQAELGDLSARARQAVALTRADPSPVQIAHAHRLLAENLFSPDALFTDVDPAAAAAAAAHWLHAAATVTARASGRSLTGVILDADNIVAMPVTTLSLLFDAIGRGEGVHKAVAGLIRDAMKAAEGDLPSPFRLAEELQNAIDSAHRFAPGNRRVLQGMLSSVRTTPLDPARPARQLLEDTLTGIYGCAALYAAQTNHPRKAESKSLNKERRAGSRSKAVRRSFRQAVQDQVGALDQLRY